MFIYFIFSFVLVLAAVSIVAKMTDVFLLFRIFWDFKQGSLYFITRYGLIGYLIKARNAYLVAKGAFIFDTIYFAVLIIILINLTGIFWAQALFVSVFIVSSLLYYFNVVLLDRISNEVLKNEKIFKELTGNDLGDGV